MSSGNKTKWGIVSAGLISSDFVNAISIPAFAERHSVVAVAARSLDRARAFAKTFDIDRAYGSYEELAADNDVEVVYVGSVNPTHLSIVTMMLQHGKHVLCEKPLGINVKETEAMLNLAKEKGLFLMEAMWARCQESNALLKKAIEGGELGQVLNSQGIFGVPIEKVDRVKKIELGGGAMLDIGVYLVYATQLANSDKYPTEIKAVGKLNEEGVDVGFSAVLQYESGATAAFTAEARHMLANTFEVYGTKGKFKIESPFWCSKQVVLPNGERVDIGFDCKGAKLDKFDYNNSEFLALEADEVRKCLLEGLKESPKVTHQTILNVAKIMQEIRRQIGVVYPQDK